MEKQIRILFDKWLNSQSTDEEVKLLVQLLEKSKSEELLTEPMEVLWEQSRDEQQNHRVEWNRIYKIITSQGESKAKVITLKRFVWAAACVLVVVIAGIWMFSEQKQKRKPEIANQKPNDVLPGSDKAILVRSDGSRITLQDTKLQNLNEGGVSVDNSDGQIKYNAVLKSKETITIYNTVLVPRKGFYKLVLSDGSKVWLNSESSIKYPVAFNDNERRVEITGEAYFEVEHDATKPFHVAVNGMDVQVLGTHFNINAYNDESDMKTTLLEGQVKITEGQASEILKPGDQAQVRQYKGDENIQLVNDVDLNQVIAWQRGMFEFEHTELPVIMRQISRWYDVDVSYEGKITNSTYGGGISKNLPLSSVLIALESAGLHFRLDGRKLIVTP